MVSLNTQTVNTTFTVGSVTTPLGGGVSIQIPNSSVMLAKPISYEFRVVEHIENGNIVRVGLQYQIWEHDNYGGGIVKHPWADVPRVQKDVATGAVTDIIPT